MAICRGGYHTCSDNQELGASISCSLSQDDDQESADKEFHDALTTAEEDGKEPNVSPPAIEYGINAYDPREIVSEPTWLASDERDLQIVPVEEAPPALSEVSLWVLTQMQVVTHYLGLAFEGVEKQAIELFTTLEREISNYGSEINCQWVNRELQNLRSEILRSSGRRRKGSLGGTRCSGA